MQSSIITTETKAFQVDIRLPQDTRLRFSKEYERTKAWRILSRYLSRYPHDLRVHAQRIFLALEPELNDNLKGALQDLTIALSGKGKPFFESLLEQAQSILSDSEQKQLLADFEQENSHRGWRKGSILANGISHNQTLVAVTDESQQPEFSNVLEEAAALLEYGDIDEARELLENELLNKSDSISDSVSDSVSDSIDVTAIEDELLFLYQSIREPDYITSMSQKLRDLGTELSPEWKQCLDEATSW